jgi:2'-5' RNA ligase
MIRAFIAITPPASLYQCFMQVQQAFQTQSIPLRWIKPEHVHLTLKFLGNVEPEMVDRVAQVMGQATRGQGAFPLLVRSLGCFPNLSRPRVLWMGLNDPAYALAPLYQRLESELAPLGFSPEARPFRPHLTLARTQQRISRGKLGALLQTYHDRQFGEMTVEHIRLFQSHLYREGVVYTVLRSVTLQSRRDEET